MRFKGIHQNFRRAMLTSAALSALAHPAAAQDSLAGVLEEILVKSQRRAENIQDVPIAVTALSGDDLEFRRSDSIQDIFLTTPNVSFAVIGGNEARTDVLIRGVNNLGGAASPYGFYVDELSAVMAVTGRAGAQGLRAFDANLIDAEVVEVLRGPQGIFFGRNATAGAINITTRAPGETFGGSINVDFGVEGTDDVDSPYATVRGAIDIPLSDNLRTRTVAYYSQADGWINDIGPAGNTNDRENYGIRFALQALPSDRTTIDLSISYSDQSGGIDVQLPSGRGLTGGEFNFGLPLPLPFVEAQGTWPNNLDTVSTDTVSQSSNQTLIFNARINHDFDWAKLTLIGGYVDNEFSDAGSDLDFTSVNVFEGGNIGKGTNTSLEVRLASPAEDRFSWTVGGLYASDEGSFDIESFFGQATPFAGAPLVVHENTQEFESFAVFANLEYDISESLSLAVGARYSNDDVRLETQTASLFPAFSIPFREQDTSSDDISPRFNLTYTPNDDMLVYATVAKGYKAAGFDPNPTAAGADNLFEPEQLWNYELGFKGEFFDNRLRLNASAYFIDWSDIQILVFNSATFSSDAQNAASATAKGFELETVFAATENLTLSLNYGFNDGQLGDDFECTLQSTVVACPNEPFGIKHQVGAIVDYRRAIGTDLDFIARAEYKYQSEVRDFQNNSAFDNGAPLPMGAANADILRPLPVGGYDIANLRIGLDAPQWSVTAYAENFIGTPPDIGSRQLFVFLSGEQVSVQPKQFGVRATYKFN